MILLPAAEQDSVGEDRGRCTVKLTERGLQGPSQIPAGLVVMFPTFVQNLQTVCELQSARTADRMAAFPWPFLSHLVAF